MENQSKIGGLFNNSKKYFELPQSYRDEINDKMCVTFGKGVLTEQNPTPMQKETFEEMLTHYHDEYRIEQQTVEYFDEN